MPTNLLRTARTALPPYRRDARRGERRILITVGAVTIPAVLADTMAATRIWAALPLFSIAETWGDSIHFELPIVSGRERGAKINGEPGEIYHWAEDDRVLIVFGPTPISRPNEVRLPRPCNVLARTDANVAVLAAVQPGAKVSIRQAGETPGSPHGS